VRVAPVAQLGDGRIAQLAVFPHALHAAVFRGRPKLQREMRERVLHPHAAERFFQARLRFRHAIGRHPSHHGMLVFGKLREAQRGAGKSEEAGEAERHGRSVSAAQRDANSPTFSLRSGAPVLCARFVVREHVTAFRVAKHFFSAAKIK